MSGRCSPANGEKAQEKVADRSLEETTVPMQERSVWQEAWRLVVDFTETVVAMVFYAGVGVAAGFALLNC